MATANFKGNININYHKIMVSHNVFTQLTSAFPATEILPHFHKISFRLKNQIFATFDEKHSIAMVKLSLIDQSVFCAFDKNVIYPVPGTWRQKGATYIDLKKIRKTMLKDALTCAYNNLFEKKK